MAEERQQVVIDREQQGQRAGRFFGSLKDALVAASRDDTAPAKAVAAASPEGEAVVAEAVSQATQIVRGDPPPGPSAAEAAREARAGGQRAGDRHFESDAPPTTRVVRALSKERGLQARTTVVRGKINVKRGAFEADPVVGWLVIVGGPGIGQYRPIFEGNNTMGRSSTNRIPVDFGDDAISSEEQAYIRYDSSERTFLFVPNLAKTNVVSVNEKRPTGAVELGPMDLITMGQTQLVFVPFCGPEFDWSALADTKG